MLKKIVFSLSALLILPVSVSAFDGGTGVEGDPYQISTCQHVQDIQNDLGAYYILTGDVDCSAFSNYHPLGNATDDGFTGDLNGAHFAISNLEISTTTHWNVGLFAYNESGMIRNLTLENVLQEVELASNGDIGGIAAYNNGSIAGVTVTGSVGNAAEPRVGLVAGVNYGIINNATASGTVLGADYVGGVVGNNSGNIYYASFTGTVTGDGSYVGGLIGLSAESDRVIEDSTVEANVTGTGDYVGGFVGTNYSDISNSSFEGDVEGGGSVGGFAGDSYADITSSHSRGNITATGFYAGGFVGDNQGGTISNSSFTGTVTGVSDSTGGFVGNNDEGTITDSYAAADVESTAGYGIGGFVGASWDGLISDSYATGTVTATTEDAYGVGGFIGSNYGTTTNSYSTGDVISAAGFATGGFAGENGTYIGESYSTGDVTGVSAVGGFVGENYGLIENSYSRGDADGTDNVGGFVGDNSSYDAYVGMISKSYSTGGVTGDTNVNGFGVYTDGEANDSFWDTETSLVAESDLGMGMTTAAMKLLDTFTNTATEGLEEAWDFETVWGINDTDNDGYPFLRFQGFTHDNDEEDPEPEDEEDDDRGSSGSRRSSGSSCGVKCKFNNLIKSGKIMEAIVLIQEWPEVFGLSNSVSAETNGAPNAGSTNDFIFTKDLYVGIVDEEVRELQKKLNKLGFVIASFGPGSVGSETNIFGNLTKEALIKFQQANSIVPSVGYFGPLTRNVINNK